MFDSFTVTRKELIELLGNRHSARGALIQAGVLTTIAGILVPAVDPAVWRSPTSMAMMYLLFPSTLAAAVAADAFAGERERKTLETLLATPLADGAIFVGKALTAILFASAVSATAILCSIITINLRAAGGGLFLPPAAHIAALLGGGVGAASITTSLAIFVSMRVAVARSAQQVASLSSLLIAGGTVALLGQLGIPLTFQTLPWVDAALLGAGAVALRVAMGLFRRDRVFEQR